MSHYSDAGIRYDSDSDVEVPTPPAVKPKAPKRHKPQTSSKAASSPVSPRVPPPAHSQPSTPITPKATLPSSRDAVDMSTHPSAQTSNSPIAPVSKVYNLLEYCDVRKDIITDYLADDDVKSYPQMYLPIECFDYMLARAKYPGPYVKMLKQYGLDHKSACDAIAEKLAPEYESLFDDMLGGKQLHSLATYLLNQYLNYIQCPRQFHLVYTENTASKRGKGRGRGRGKKY